MINPRNTLKFVLINDIKTIILVNNNIQNLESQLFVETSLAPFLSVS